MIYDDDENETNETWECSVCGGLVELLGALGKLKYGRCRDCGIETFHPSVGEEPDNGKEKSVEDED